MCKGFKALGFKGLRVLVVWGGQGVGVGLGRRVVSGSGCRGLGSLGFDPKP